MQKNICGPLEGMLNSAVANKILYFRTRGGPKHGWGNIIRLGAFAAYCRERGDKGIRFFVEGPQEVITYLSNQGFQTTNLPDDVSFEEESKALSNFPKADIFIMEMEDCNYHRQLMLKNHTNKLVVFDDLLDHQYCADIVVCGQSLPGYGNKDISSQTTEFFLGLDYFLSRPEFNPYITKNRSYSESIKNILISLGGGQYDVAHLKVARALAACTDPITPSFILGYAAQDKLKNEIRKLLPHAIIHSGVNNIEQMFWECDLAIVSGGYNKLEAAITGTPAIIIAVQWHQIPLAEEFSRESGMPYVGYMSYIHSDDIKREIERLKSQKKRREICIKSKTVIDGHGFERVYSEIFH